MPWGEPAEVAEIERDLAWWEMPGVGDWLVLPSAEELERRIVKWNADAFPVAETKPAEDEWWEAAIAEELGNWSVEKPEGLGLPRQMCGQV